MPDSPNEVQKNKPVHEIRLGMIKGLIWEFDTPNGPKLYTTFERLYVDDKEKDSKNKWKSTGFFDAAQSLTQGKVAELCSIWMYGNPPQRSANAESEC